MKTYFTLNEAAFRIYNLCKSIWNFDSDVRDYPHYPEYVEDVLKVGHKVIWISKFTGFLYFDTPKIPNNYLQVKVTWHEDKYELELV